jgi:hypothetical protein
MGARTRSITERMKVNNMEELTQKEKNAIAQLKRAITKAFNLNIRLYDYDSSCLFITLTRERKEFIIESVPKISDFGDGTILHDDDGDKYMSLDEGEGGSRR